MSTTGSTPPSHPVPPHPAPPASPPASPPSPPSASGRIVFCRLLKKDLPGLDRPPYKNELGRRIFEEVSKDGWQQWLKDSVRFVNTYRVDLVTPEGQKFMLKQCAIYFGYEEGDVAQTAWTPPTTAGESKG